MIPFTLNAADETPTTMDPVRILRQLTEKPVYLALLVGSVVLVLVGLGFGINALATQTPTPPTIESVTTPSKVPEM